MKIEFKCDYCGKIVRKSPSEIRNYKHHFCNRNCKNKYRTNRIKIKCDYCGKIIERNSFRIKKNKHHFCSRKCQGKWLYRKKEVKCDFCGKVIKKIPYNIKNFEHHFCNKKCRGKYMSKFLKGNNNPLWRGKVEVKCDWCGKTIKKHPCSIKSNKHHFCNRKCRADFFKGENNPNWRDGKSREPYSFVFDNKLKEQIRKRDNFTCQECFRHQDELRTKNNRPYKLHIHHLDYCKKNNSFSNLISLCKSCHSQTNYGRDDWTKYYQEKIKPYIVCNTM